MQLTNAIAPRIRQDWTAPVPTVAGHPAGTVHVADTQLTTAGGLLGAATFIGAPLAAAVAFAGDDIGGMVARRYAPAALGAAALGLVGAFTFAAVTRADWFIHPITRSFDGLATGFQTEHDAFSAAEWMRDAGLQGDASVTRDDDGTYAVVRLQG